MNKYSPQPLSFGEGLSHPSNELTKPVIIFDGVCNYCTAIINFLARHDTRDHFLFTPSQTEAGKKLLKEIGLHHVANNTVILVEKDIIYTKSTAILRVCKKLNGIIPLSYSFMIIPSFLRNAVYDLIAGNRYKWFGKKETCMVPDERMRRKFLE